MSPDSADAQHVFISFASVDAPLVHRVVASLEQAGVRCWFSERDIEPAASYPTAITDAVTRSGAVLLLLTSAANQSPHVVREIELAFSARRPILPVRIGGASPSPDLQYFLSRSQWLNAGASLDEAELAAVQARLADLLRSGTTIGGFVLEAGRPWLRITAAAVAIAAVAAALFFWRGGTAPGLEQPASPPDGPPIVPAGTGTTGLKTNPGDGQLYVWIPPGTFTMGCSDNDPTCEDDEKPPHIVAIPRGFWLARTEAVEQGSNLPVAEVSWAAARARCEAVGGRLPTEAEWEYAARAGTSTRYYAGLQAIAWYEDNSDSQRHPVGGKAANAFGLHDMLGNVSEWVIDRYYNKYYEDSDPIDVDLPLAANATGVARGGSWVSNPEGVRVSRRLEMETGAEEPHIGFRCAVDGL
jgi:formylglycine-generating enzyme required for sulfatase activity